MKEYKKKEEEWEREREEWLGKEKGLVGELHTEGLKRQQLERVKGVLEGENR